MEKTIPINEKSQLESEISLTRNLAKEMKRDRDKHEAAFAEGLSQFVEKWTLPD
jgi:hypothetical protein